MANVLIVDDERSIRITLREFLIDADYEVDVAEDAAEAMERLGREEYDVVLADIILPQTTGVELLKVIKKKSPRVQVILMTGEPTVETAAEAVRSGAFDYVSKPIGREMLLKVVANAAKYKALNDQRARLAEENRQYQAQLERLLEERTVALRASNRALTVLSECGQALAQATLESSPRSADPPDEDLDDPPFIQEIFKAFESAQQRVAAETPAELRAVASDPEVVETLSNREIEVVGLLSERMRDKEIAARLFISPETVKSHLRNIYGKLEAHSRRQAVYRARKVGILKPSR